MRIIFYTLFWVHFFTSSFFVSSDAKEFYNNTEHANVQGFPTSSSSRDKEKTSKRRLDTTFSADTKTYNKYLMIFKSANKPMIQTLLNSKETIYTRSGTRGITMNTSQDHTTIEEQTNDFDYNKKKTTSEHVYNETTSTKSVIKHDHSTSKSNKMNTPFQPEESQLEPKIVNMDGNVVSDQEVKVTFETDRLFKLSELNFTILVNDKLYGNVQKEKDISVETKKASIYVSKLEPGKVFSLKLTLFGSSSRNISVITKPKKACNIKQLNQTQNAACFSWYQEGGYDGFEIYMNEAGDKIDNPFVFEEIKKSSSKLVDETQSDSKNMIKIDDGGMENALNDIDCENDLKANVKGCVKDLKPGETTKYFLKTISNNEVSPLEKFLLYTNPSKPESITFRNRTATSLCIAWIQKGAYKHFSIKSHNQINYQFDWRALETSEILDKLEGCIKGLAPATKIEFSLRSHLDKKIFSETSYINYTGPFKPSDVRQLNSTRSSVCIKWQQQNKYTGFFFQVSNQHSKSGRKKIENPRNVLEANGFHQIEACLQDPAIKNDFNLSLMTFYNADSGNEIISESTCFIGVANLELNVQKNIGEDNEGSLVISRGIYENIQIHITPDLPNIECDKNKCFLKNLKSDTRYTFNVNATKNGPKHPYCYSYDKVTSNSTDTFLTFPGKVREMKLQEMDSGQVNITWRPPQQHKNIHSYSFFLNDTLETEMKCSNVSSNCSSIMWFVLSELVAGAIYIVNVSAKNEMGDGRPEQLVIVGKKIDTGLAVWKVIVLLILALMAAVVLAVLFIFRRRIHQSFISKHAKTLPPNVTVLELEIQEPAPMKIDELMQELNNKHKDSDYLFSKEYELLNETSPKFPTTVALKPENKTKNRFNDILAFDHSRVKLSGCDMTDTGDVNDYINANFIPGYLSKRQYIASQGPMKGTLDDFWRMVWDHKVTCIVMLTKLFEKEKEKCSKYWSDDNEKEYGDVKVELSNTQNYDFYEERTFKVSVDSESRCVSHFWFLNWPDFGVPCKKQLLKFLTEVRLSNNSKHPTIVHCSAGVGRTGTFILLDRIIHSINHDNYVDVFSVVKDMRKYRCRMVQTEAQYIFAHDCITEEIFNSSALLCYENGEPGKLNDTFLRENFYVNPSYKSLKVKN